MDYELTLFAKVFPLSLHVLCLQRHIWSPLTNFIYGVIGFVGGILGIWLLETINTKLPDTLEEAESAGNR